MSNLFTENRGSPRWLGVIPFVALAAVLLLEVETVNIRVTPSLLTIALAIFSVFLTPRAVFWWAALISVLVVATLIFVPNNGVYETPAFVVLRSMAYFAVAIVAVALSRYRRDSEAKLKGLMELFDSLKTPIVVSDIDGNINFANQACCEVLGRSAEEIKDTNFFSVFSQPDQRGQSIDRYLKLFNNDPGRSSELMVSIAHAPNKALRHANCFTMQWDHRKLLVTQLS